MPEIRREVKPIMFEYACDECSQKPNPGCILVRTDKMVFLTFPAKFEYECSNCKKIFELNNFYPRVEYG